MSAGVSDRRIYNLMQTFSGREYAFSDFSPSDVCIEDIAHGLSNICRFAGQTREFYSVAQHSVVVSLVTPKEDACWGLLHDASEAYLGDVLWGIKNGYSCFDVYRDLERKFQGAVNRAFHLLGICPESVFEADRIALSAETRDLFDGGRIKVLCRHVREGEVSIIQPWSPSIAKSSFLARWEEVCDFESGGPHG